MLLLGPTVSAGGGAGVGEPTYDSGQDTALLFETFEGFADKAALLTYDFDLGRWTYDNSGTYIEFPSPTAAHGGTKAMRINYPANATYTDQGQVLEGGIGGATSSVPQYAVVQFYLRTKTDYPWRRLLAADQDGAGEKTIIWNQGDPVRFVLGCGTDPAGTFWGGEYDDDFPDDGVGVVLSVDGSGVGPGTFWYFQNAGKASMTPNGTMNDGNYHRWTIKMTPGTFQNSSGGDGIIGMWVDGVQVLDYDGSNAARPEHNLVCVPRAANVLLNLVDVGGPFNGAPSPTQGDQWKDYDDIKIWIRP